MRWWWLLAAGCAGDASEAPTDTGTAPTCEVAVAVGTGVVHYEPLGEVLGIVHGPQGGWHVTAAARFCGLGGRPTASSSAWWVQEDVQVGQSPVYDKLPVPLDDEGCCFEMVDMTTYLLIPDGRLAGPTLHDQDIVLSVTVMDDEGVAHRDEQTVHLDDPEQTGAR